MWRVLMRGTRKTPVREKALTKVTLRRENPHTVGAGGGAGGENQHTHTLCLSLTHTHSHTDQETQGTDTHTRQGSVGGTDRKSVV